MLEYWLEIGQQIIKLVGSMNRTQWLMIFGVIVVIGFVCMRGFGSRTNY